jgi:outer membrane lipoprotein SlyB
MQTSQRLHPLLTAAAISITVFSAVGVATLTGLMPPSIGSQQDEPEVLQPVEPVAPAPTAQPVLKQEPVAKAVIARAPAVTAASQVTETPKPVVLPGSLGTVQAVREVKHPGEHTAMGPVAGGVAGAVIGSQIGGGSGKKVMTVLGALGGAMAGKHIEKQARGTTHWEVDVRHDSGAQETVLSDAAPPYYPGARVRVLDGRLEPA